MRGGDYGEDYDCYSGEEEQMLMIPVWLDVDSRLKTSKSVNRLLKNVLAKRIPFRWGKMDDPGIT